MRKERIIKGVSDGWQTLRNCAVAIAERPIIRGLCQRVCGLLLRPEEEWKKIASEEKSWREVQEEYLYPMWIAVTVSIVLHLVYVIWYNVYTPGAASVLAFTHFVVYTLGFFVIVLTRMSTYTFPMLYGMIERVVFLPSWVMRFIRWFEVTTVRRDYEPTCVFIAYCQSLAFCTEILENLLPLLSGILYVVNFYIIYVVWQGYWQYMRNSDDERDESFPFALTTMIIIYVIPKVMLRVVDAFM